MVGNNKANALWRVPRRFEHANRCLAKFQLESLTHGHVRKRRSCLRSHVNLRARTRGQFLMSGDKIGMQVRIQRCV